jgi:hypothetical protein
LLGGATVSGLRRVAVAERALAALSRLRVARRRGIIRRVVLWLSRRTDAMFWAHV